MATANSGTMVLVILTSSHVAENEDEANLDYD